MGQFVPGCPERVRSFLDKRIHAWPVHGFKQYGEPSIGIVQDMKYISSRTEPNAVILTEDNRMIAVNQYIQEEDVIHSTKSVLSNPKIRSLLEWFLERRRHASNQD